MLNNNNVVQMDLHDFVLSILNKNLGRSFFLIYFFFSAIEVKHILLYVRACSLS